MGLKRNIVANYVSQAYAAAAGILTVPVYAAYMGTEAYGLVGFYAMLQAWFQLLDIGLSSTLARECARFNAGQVSPALVRQLRMLLEAVFLAIAVLALVVFQLAADAVATRWLNTQHLAPETVTTCIAVMGWVVALRWCSCLYRGMITGFEDQAWLGGFNIVVTTLRFVLCIPVMALYDASPLTFFVYQVGVSAVEAAGLRWRSQRLLPRAAPGTVSAWDWPLLLPMLGFAGSAGFTSIVWVLVTQVDRLVLSRLLPLGDFGAFTMAALLASGISLLSGPISAALLPRLTRDAAAGQDQEVRALYRRFTRITGVVTVPVAVTLACFAGEVLYAWTGNAEVAVSMAPTLALYALGNALLAYTAFAYYIQYARGDLRLHLIGNAVFVMAYLPGVVAGARWAGATGAGAAWLLMNLLYLLAWVPGVHRRLLPGLHGTWLRQDIGRVLLAVLVPVALLLAMDRPQWNRVEGGLAAVAFGIACLFSCLISVPETRQMLRRRPARH